MSLDSLDELNRAINRALRAINEVAVGVASSSLRDRNTALKESTEALAHIDSLQRVVVAEDPGLEYHYDPKREPSRTMKEISVLMEVAENHIQEGSYDDALKALQDARGREPPPLIYEIIEKKIAKLRTARR